MKNNPKISIITVVYNGEEFLEETILSILNQSYENIITHKIDGYRAKPFDGKDLTVGIEWIVSNENYDQLC